MTSRPGGTARNRPAVTQTGDTLLSGRPVSGSRPVFDWPLSQVSDIIAPSRRSAAKGQAGT